MPSYLNLIFHGPWGFLIYMPPTGLLPTDRRILAISPQAPNHKWLVAIPNADGTLPDLSATSSDFGANGYVFTSKSLVSSTTNGNDPQNSDPGHASIYGGRKNYAWARVRPQDLPDPTCLPFFYNTQKGRYGDNARIHCTFDLPITAIYGLQAGITDSQDSEFAQFKLTDPNGSILSNMMAMVHVLQYTTTATYVSDIGFCVQNSDGSASKTLMYTKGIPCDPAISAAAPDSCTNVHIFGQSDQMSESDGSSDLGDVGNIFGLSLELGGTEPDYDEPDDSYYFAAPTGPSCNQVKKNVPFGIQLPMDELDLLDRSILGDMAPVSGATISYAASGFSPISVSLSFSSLVANNNASIPISITNAAATALSLTLTPNVSAGNGTFAVVDFGGNPIASGTIVAVGPYQTLTFNVVYVSDGNPTQGNITLANSAGKTATIGLVANGQGPGALSFPYPVQRADKRQHLGLMRKRRGTSSKASTRATVDPNPTTCGGGIVVCSCDPLNCQDDYQTPCNCDDSGGGSGN